MRAIRTWGSVRGVSGNWYPYRDQRLGTDLGADQGTRPQIPLSTPV